MSGGVFAAKILVAAIFFSLVFLMVLPPLIIQRNSHAKPARDNAGQIRAIWVQYNAANTAEKIDEMLDVASEAGFNTIIYLVGSGDVVYDSSLLPRYGPSSGFDALAYVVDRAHAKGMQVEAWWCPGRAPETPSFRSKYPDWDIATDTRIPDDFHWLNFSMPEVKDFVGEIVVEIATKYDVDAVHLDYIRFPAPPPYNPIDCRKYFGPNAVSRTVEAAYSKLKAIRPNTGLTAAVVDGQASSTAHLQNWARWLNDGYIDHVIPMAYYGPDQEHLLVRRIREWGKLPGAERIVVGFSVSHVNGSDKDDPKSGEKIIRQMELADSHGFSSTALFDFSELTPEIIDRLSEHN